MPAYNTYTRCSAHLVCVLGAPHLIPAVDGVAHALGASRSDQGLAVDRRRACWCRRCTEQQQQGREPHARQACGRCSSDSSDGVGAREPCSGGQAERCSGHDVPGGGRRPQPTSGTHCPAASPIEELT